MKGDGARHGLRSLPARLPRVILTLTLPVAVFLAARGATEAALVHFHPRWTDAGWSRWDAQHYLSIAMSGYLKFPCANNPSDICGNVGWFPAYPLLVRPLAALMPALSAARLVSAVLGALGFVLLFALVRRRHGARAATWTILAAATAPGALFWHAAFPYALYLALSVGVAYACERRWWALAAPLAAALAATYPSGPLIAVLVMAPVARQLGARLDPRAREGGTHGLREVIGPLVVTAFAALGLGAYGLYNQVRFGDFFLYAHFQEKYGWLGRTFWEGLAVYWRTNPSANRDAEVTAAVFVLAVAAIFWTPRIPAAWRLYGASILLLSPLSGSMLCYYRHALVAWPLYVLVGVADVPARVRALALGAGVAIHWLVVLPRFAAGSLP